jgi:hypothetical protein
MPIGYVNFAEAWDEWYSFHLTTVIGDTVNCTDSIDLAIASGYSEDGFWYTLDAVYYLLEAFIFHATYGIKDEDNGAHAGALYWAGQGDGAVDMDAILSAMITADYDQLQKFIGIEDAYRSAIWDQPFNAQFYAALAQGFRL